MPVHAWAIAFVSIQKRLNIQAKSSPTCHWAQPDSSAWFFSTGGLMITAVGTDSLTGLLKLHIHTHTRPFLFYIRRQQHSFLNGLWFHVLKKKPCEKWSLFPMSHQSDLQDGVCSESLFIGNKHLMMVLHSSELNQWVKTLCSITLFLGVSSILSASADILHCLK